MQTYNEWTRGYTTKIITIECRDGNNTLEDLLNYIKGLGNTGHSFSIVVDPKSDAEKKFHWDGDGSDSIKSIKAGKNKLSLKFNVEGEPTEVED